MYTSIKIPSSLTEFIEMTYETYLTDNVLIKQSVVRQPNGRVAEGGGISSTPCPWRPHSYPSHPLFKHLVKQGLFNSLDLFAF